jgi:SAM-dependent methyltransferase
LKRKLTDSSKHWEELASENIPDADTVAGGSLRRSKVTHGGSLFLEYSFTLPDRKRVLDAPCGYGRYLVPISKRVEEAIGIDLSSSLLKRCKANLRNNGMEPRLVRGDIRFLPFRNSVFNMVVCMSSLYYLEPQFWPRIFRQFADVLSEGGELDVDMWMRTDLWTLRYGFGILLALARIVYELEKVETFGKLWRYLGLRTLHGLYIFFTTRNELVKIIEASGMRCLKIIQGRKAVFVCEKSQS